MIIEHVEGDESRVRWNNGDGWHYADIDDLIRVYESAPTVDVESLITKHEDIGYEKGYRDGYAEALEVTDDTKRHGHWIFGETMGHSWMKCSECCVSQSGQTATFTYCPNCGAKMDSERREDG